jgi:plasmid stabilization system protein ParE
MRCTVVWDPKAENDLATIWTFAPDQQAVAVAADEIDRLLRIRSLTVGEEFGKDRRLEVKPLAVVYSVYPDDCLVRVQQVVFIK